MISLSFTQLYSPSLELIVFVVVIVIDIFLAFTVYRSNPKGATNIIFTLLTLSTMLWLVIGYLVGIPELADSVILNRLGIFFAAPQALLFFLLAHTMPSQEIQLRRRTLYLLIAVTAFVMALNVSPYAFVTILISGNAIRPQVGLGIIPFAIFAVFFSTLSIYWLIRKYLYSTGIAKTQLQLVLIGILTMLGLIIATILVPIVFLNTAPSLSMGPLYTLAFLGMTAYAISRYQLFSIKVLVTQTLTFTIWVVLFARIFVDVSMNFRVLDSLVLIFAIIFGILLIRSVQEEVKQREEIEKLSLEKSEFMSFASHEIRNPITAMRGYASLIVDGTTGEALPEVKDAAEKILVNGNTVLGLISQFLSKSKLELGQLSYTITDFDVEEIVTSVADGFKPHAQQKGLILGKHVEFKHLRAHGDEGKVREVIGNILDNSIKYTKTGSIIVLLEKRNGMARVTIADTGVGIPHDTLSHLFQKFSRADAQKMNLLGTGLGLYLAKTLIEGMGGKIWAESDGQDKGSKFIIELPAV